MHRARLPLNKRDFDVFHESGILYVESFYESADIIEIQKGVHNLFGIIISTHQLPIEQEPFSPATFDSGIEFLRRDYRPLLGQIYDAIKKLPDYVSLACCRRHKAVAEFLLGSDFVGIANRGYGIRMDHPGEDAYLTQLHQDYTSQLCSPSGVVFWSPLRAVTTEMGPVTSYEGSHLQGIQSIDVVGEGSYGLQLRDPQKAIASCPAVRPEVGVTDALILNTLTVHESSPSRGRHTRWSMISRYFDFKEPTGCSYGWKGGIQEGNSFATIHPEFSRIP
jgi:hypothetical protein